MMHQHNAIFRHDVKLANTNIMSGAITIEMVDIASKMPRTFTSLQYVENVREFLPFIFYWKWFSLHLISVTYAEQGAFMKPHPSPNKKQATNIIHTDDEQ